MAEILIVDDDDAVAEMIKLRLDRQGHSVHLAHDGGSGVEEAWRLMPDLVLMDLHMPGMNGYGAVKLLRQWGYDGPVVSISAAASKEDREKALAAGCNAAFVKPIGRDFEQRIVEVLRE